MIIVKEVIKPPLVIIPALSYLMLATRQAVTHIQESRRFQLMYTLQGKQIHTTHISYVSTHHSYASYGQSPYVATFRGVINSIELIHWP
jgi:hypothetical protein